MMEETHETTQDTHRPPGGSIWQRQLKLPALVTWLVLIGLTSILLFLGLGNQPYWSGEAEYVQLARNTVQQGYPTYWDGRTLLPAASHTVQQEDFVVREAPWLPHYLAGLGITLFGDNPFGVRFPFATLALFGVACFYIFCTQWTGEYDLAELATLLLVLSPSFLLYMRQAGEPPLLFFAGLILFCTMFSVSLLTWQGLFLCVSSATILFYTNVSVSVGMMLSMSVVYLMQRQHEPLRGILSAWMLWLACTLPWWWWGGSAGDLRQLLTLPQHLHQSLLSFGYYMWSLNAVQWLPILLLFLFILVSLRLPAQSKERVQARHLSRLGGTFAIVFLLYLSMTVPVRRLTMAYSKMYLATALLPFMAMIIAYTCVVVGRRSRTLGLLLVVLAIYTDTLTLRAYPAYPVDQGQSPIPRTTLVNLLQEVGGAQPNLSAQLSDYLATQAEPNETVLVNTRFLADILTCSVGDRVQLCGVLDPNDPRAVTHNLPKHLWSSETVPDWVIKSGPIPFQRRDILDYVSDQGHRYDLVALEAFWAETGRPEIPFHSFRPLNTHSIQERILIYQPTRLRKDLISRAN